MDAYIKEKTDNNLPMQEIYNRARKGKGARFLTVERCKELICFLQSKKSAVTTAEHTAISLSGEWLPSQLDFFWEQKLPEGQSWESFYNMLNNRFLNILDSTDTNDAIHYFDIWAGMKGDESYD